MDHPVEVVVGVLLLGGVWGYVHLVAWHGMRWHLRAAWTGGRTIRTLERQRRRADRTLDRQLRALLDEETRGPVDRPRHPPATHDRTLRRRGR